MRWPGIGFKRREKAPEGKTASDVDPEAEPKQPTRRRESDAAILSLVKEREEDASKRLQDYLPEIALGLAFEDGNQWVEWDREADGRGRLVDTRSPDDLRFYRVCNLMRPLILTNVARFTSGRPDVIVTPLSTTPLEMQAAEEARAVLDWYNERLDLRDTLRRLTHYNQCATVAVERFWWDAKKKAAVPGEGAFQPEREEPEPADPTMAPMPEEPAEATGPSGYVEAEVGDICSDVLLGHQLLCDPRAKEWSDLGWVITREVMSLKDVKARYGVDLTSETTRRDLLPSVSDQSIRSKWFESTMPPKAVNVSTMYEAPTDRYPEGRTITATEIALLAYEESLPCGVIPLVPLQYQPRQDSVYGRGIAADMAQPQFDYNRVRSYMGRGVAVSTKIVLTREMGDGAGADMEEELEEGPRVVTIRHLPGKTPPQFQTPQFNLDACLAAMQLHKDEMSDLAGVHIVSSGQGDPNARSGYAIRLLQDSDRTMHAPYVQAIERFVEERARMILKFASHYVAEPRVWGLDDSDNPQEAEQRISSLPALRAGGAVAVRVIEASGTPRTPEAMDEEVLGLFGQGLAGDPADPATRKAVLESLQSPAATRLKEAVEKALVEFPPAPPEPPTPPPGMPGEMPPPPIPNPEMDPMMAAMTGGGAPVPPMMEAPPMPMDPSMGLPPL